MARIIIKLALLAGFLASTASAQYTYTDWKGTALNLATTGCVIEAIPYVYYGNPCIVKYSGAGPWTSSGSSSFGPSARICVIQPDHSCDGGTSSGTGPVELRIQVSFDGIPNATTASFSRPVVVSGVTIPVTMNMHSPVTPIYGAYSKKTDAEFISAGCTTDSYFANLCPDVQLGPNGGYTVPTLGTWGLEPNFKTPIMNIGNDHLPYSEFAYTSADSGLVLTQHLGFMPLPGNNLGLAVGTGIYKSGFGSNINCGFYTNLPLMTMRGWNEATWFCGNGTSLHRIRGVSPAFTSYVDDGAIFTLPDGQSSLCLFTAVPDGHVLVWGAMNGDCANNYDVNNWKAVYLVNLYPPHNYTRIDLTAAPWAAFINTRRFEVLGVDKEGWYYMHDGSAGAINWYRFKADGTTEYIGPISANNYASHTIPTDCNVSRFQCLQSGHQASYNYGNTMGVLVQSGYPYSPEDVAQVYNPMRGASFATVPVQIGGGGTWAYGAHDYQTAAKSRPLVVSSHQWQNGFGWPPVMGVLSISGATFTLQDWVTGTPNLGTLNPGDQIVIGCENSNPGAGTDIRGLWTVSSVATSPYRVTVSGLAYSGSFDRSTTFCAATKATPITPSTTNSRGAVHLFRFSQNGDIIQATRIAKRRTPPWGCCLSDSGGDAYTSGAFTQITQDGKYVMWNESNYTPNDMHVMAAQTPWPMLSQNDNELAPGYPMTMTPTGSGHVTVQARAPEPTDLKCDISLTRTMSIDGACTGSAPTNGCTVTLAGPYTVRSATFTGAAGTPYYWRCYSTDSFYASAGAVAVR